MKKTGGRKSCWTVPLNVVPYKVNNTENKALNSKYPLKKEDIFKVETSLLIYSEKQ